MRLLSRLIMGMILLGVVGCQTVPIQNLLVEGVGVILKPDFENGVTIQTMEIVKPENETGQTYVVRTGKDSDGNCIISRTEVFPVRQGESFRYVMRVEGTTETCAGKNCTHCSFKTTGGCDCKNSTNICEHTITKNHDILVRY